MFKKSLVLLLMTLMFNLTNASLVLAQSQTDKNTQLTNEIKAKIAKFGTGEKAKVKIELKDKTKFKGFVSAIESDSFTLTDKTGATTKIDYSQVKKADRDGLSTGTKIAIFGGIGAGATVLLLLFRSYWCNENPC